MTGETGRTEMWREAFAEVGQKWAAVLAFYDLAEDSSAEDVIAAAGWNAALAAVEEAVGGLSMPAVFARGDSGLAGAWIGGQWDALSAIASLRKPVTP